MAEKLAFLAPWEWARSLALLLAGPIQPPPPPAVIVVPPPTRTIATVPPPPPATLLEIRESPMVLSTALLFLVLLLLALVASTRSRLAKTSYLRASSAPLVADCERELSEQTGGSGVGSSGNGTLILVWMTRAFKRTFVAYQNEVARAAKLEQVIEAKNKLVLQLNSRIDQLCNVMACHNNDIRGLEQQLKRKIKAKDKQLLHLATLYDGIRSSLDSTLDQFSHVLIRNGIALACKDDVIRSLEERLNKAPNVDLSQQNDALEKKIKELRSENDDLNQAFLDLQFERNNIHRYNWECNQHIEKQDAELTQLRETHEASRQSHADEKKVLEDALAAVKTQLEEERRSLAAFSTDDVTENNDDVQEDEAEAGQPGKKSRKKRGKKASFLSKWAEEEIRAGNNCPGPDDFPEWAREEQNHARRQQLSGDAEDFATYATKVVRDTIKRLRDTGSTADLSKFEMRLGQSD